MWNIAMMAQAKAASSDQDTSAAEVQADPQQAVKDDAKSDAAKIQTTFETKGVEEAWETLKKERQNSKLAPADQDAWEKTIVTELGNSKNKVLLPALSIAYLNENKDDFTNANGFIKKDEVRHKKDFTNLSLQNDKPGEPGTDDVDAMLINATNDAIKKDFFAPLNSLREFRRNFWEHKQNSEEAIKTSYLPDAMKMADAMGKKEAAFIVNRDANRSIADRMAGDDKLFSLIDEHNKDNKVDGKITVNEVDRFLKHVDSNEYYKKNFTDAQINTARDLQKSLKDTNTYEDPNGTLLTHKGVDGKTILAMSKAGWIPEDKLPGVTKETLQKSVSTPAPKEEIKVESTTGSKTTDEKAKEETADEKTTDEKAKNEKSVNEKSEEEKTHNEKVIDLYSGEYENQLVSDGTQKVGEGPWQVASRLLKGKNDPAAQKALTEILKQQLVEDTKSQNYKEAVTKLEVGHTFLTCEGLNHLREKAKESGNQTLIKLFGEPKMQAAANAVTNFRGGWA
ncbi:MAG: hypothetical protein IT342_11865 [Candidatus Melainabacteria bacterium]|nr:hypothetical protein [Candidatus Melainabacteria bacterium]